MSGQHTPPHVVVFAPTPMLTVTVEVANREPATGEIHVHAGGQGFWVARLVAELGVDATLCGCFGGEIGTVAHGLIVDAGVHVTSVATAGSNGAYVHDRRSGERMEVAAMPATELSRHEVDELYGVTLVEALRAGLLVLTGPEDPTVLSHDVYRRLAIDVRANGGMVLADLSGGPLDAVLEGGLDLVKVSEESSSATDGWAGRARCAPPPRSCAGPVRRRWSSRWATSGRWWSQTTDRSVSSARGWSPSRREERATR